MAQHFGPTQLIVLIFVTLFVYSDASLNVAEEKLNSLLPNAQDTVAFVGIADGKAYFRDSANKSVNFAEYIQFCQVNMMRTASVMSTRENEVLRKYFSDTGYWSLFWLGAWDINNEDNFEWLDTHTPFNYTNWLYDKPGNSRYGNCIYMARSGTWVIGNCQESGRVSLCELSL